jgi:hypothetical protein
LSLNEIQTEIANLPVKSRLPYLQGLIKNVEAFKDEKLYVSLSDLNNEKFELQVLRDRLTYLEDQLDELEQNPSPEISEAIKKIETDIQQLKEQVNKQQDLLKEDNKTYNSLWNQNTKLVNDIKKLRPIVSKAKSEAAVFETQNLFLESDLKRGIYVEPLPNKIGKMPLKRQKFFLKERLRKYQAQIEQVNQIVTERAQQLKQLKEKASQLNRDLSQAYINQRSLLNQLWTIINRRLPTQNNIYDLQREQHRLYSQIRRIENAPLTPLQQEIDEIELMEYILEKTINRKVIAGLQRIQLNFYVIIREKKEVEYERTYRPGENRSHGTKVKVKYPKGKFQCIINVDSFVEPTTDVVMGQIDPLLTLLPMLQEAAAEIINDRFHLVFGFSPEDFTLGATNAELGTDELGTPPMIISIARSTNDSISFNGLKRDSRFSDLNSKDWSASIGKYVMPQEEYNALITQMPDYKAELERLGKYRKGLNEY